MLRKSKLNLSSLILFTLIISPLVAGSYFGHLRWPAIILATLSPFACLTATKTPKKKHRLTTPLLLATSSILIIQGAWMWHNSWGTFSRNLFTHGVNIPWIITDNPNQPYPSLPGATDRAEAWDRISYIIPCLLLLISTKIAVSKLNLKIKHICSTIFWTGVTVATIGIIQRYTNAQYILWIDNLYEGSRKLFFGTYRSPGIATCYLTLCLNLGLAHLLATTHSLLKNSNPKPTHPILISLGCITILSATIMAGSKAGASLAIISLILWSAFNAPKILHITKNATALLPSGSPHERNILISTILAAGILATLSLGNTVARRWQSSQASDFNTLTKRQSANAIQLDMISSDEWNKLTGFGPGSFYPLFPYYKGEKGDNLTQTWVYAHNDHLQTLVEWGYLGTGCFIILIGGGGFIILLEINRRKHKHRATHTIYFKGITIAMVICLTHATVDFPFQIESIAMTFSAILGAAWASPSLRLRQKTTQ